MAVFENFRPAFSPDPTNCPWVSEDSVNVTLGTLQNYDIDGKENVKKERGLMRKTTTLHVHHAFLYISLLSLHKYLRTGTARRYVLPSLSELEGGPLSSAPTKILFFKVTGRIGIIAKKFKRMRSIFFSDVFMNVGVVGSEGPYSPGQRLCHVCDIFKRQMCVKQQQ